MKTMKWLIKREMWENKGMLLWTPIVIAGAVVTLILTGLIFGNLDTIRLYNQPLSVTIEGTARTRIVETMGEMYVTAGMPILMILGLLVFFYCLGALHDERRDRSLLFWKSLPVSDSMTVLSKLVTALVVAPLITLGVAIAVGLLMVLALCGLAAMHGTNLFGALLMTPQFYLTPLRLVALLPVYILWALPTVGWLLMVSSIARSKVFLWAVGTPIITTLLLVWAQKALHFGVDAVWFASHISSRILLGVVPGAWIGFDRPPLSVSPETPGVSVSTIIFEASWSTLGNASVWIGAAAGVAMIAVAIYMRRRREEV
jgi:ABC-2 type transport system permease protein